MAVIGCTKKLLTELRVKPSEIKQIPSALNSWHANNFLFDRRKCVLFTHDATLFSFFVPGLLKSDFQNIREVFRQMLFKNLVSEDLTQLQIELLLEDISEIEITKTSNPSVLGSMNDFINNLTLHLALDGGIANVNAFDLNRNLNRIPMGAIGYSSSINTLQNLLNDLLPDNSSCHARRPFEIFTTDTDFTL